ncbi:hypothetical protein EQG49_03160 [Periweissella cryptocerci]|uniref:Uncharacterized protein n=1 Tax=Periweissella cryptocerci TaxID=2506420 RepID=A0A4P6YS64_9LACO|nr:hypothetical protein [Periweissella cryptocerci]QBO35524.1 hypothetical protein EQG49_03160 [Periweissella cryptocerci]
MVGQFNPDLLKILHLLYSDTTRAIIEVLSDSETETGGLGISLDRIVEKIGGRRDDIRERLKHLRDDEYVFDHTRGTLVEDEDMRYRDDVERGLIDPMNPIHFMLTEFGTIVINRLMDIQHMDEIPSVTIDVAAVETVTSAALNFLSEKRQENEKTKKDSLTSPDLIIENDKALKANMSKFVRQSHRELSQIQRNDSELNFDETIAQLTLLWHNIKNSFMIIADDEYRTVQSKIAQLRGDKGLLNQVRQRHIEYSQTQSMAVPEKLARDFNINFQQMTQLFAGTSGLPKRTMRPVEGLVERLIMLVTMFETRASTRESRKKLADLANQINQFTDDLQVIRFTANTFGIDNPANIELNTETMRENSCEMDEVIDSLIYDEPIIGNYNPEQYVTELLANVTTLPTKIARIANVTEVGEDVATIENEIDNQPRIAQTIELIQAVQHDFAAENPVVISEISAAIIDTAIISMGVKKTIQYDPIPNDLNDVKDAAYRELGLTRVLGVEVQVEDTPANDQVYFVGGTHTLTFKNKKITTKLITR